MIDVEKIEDEYYEGGQQAAQQSSNLGISSSADKNKTNSSEKNRTGLELTGVVRLPDAQLPPLPGGGGGMST